MIRPRPSAVLLDAFGTLVGLDPPVPRLCRLLAEAGHDYPEPVVASALEGEMRYYRVEHDRGVDEASLAALHRDCAAVLGRGLGPGAPDLDVLTRCLVGSLRFVLLPDAVEALDALADAGVRLAVVSNWDYTLPEELERLGVAERFEAVAVSAALGTGKPDPAIFRWALARLGIGAESALHCGDHPDKDCAGAAAAGIPAVLVDRADRFPGAACPRIRRLPDLAVLIAAA